MDIDEQGNDRADAADADPHGRLDEADGRRRLTFVRRLSHHPDAVWRALTEAEHLAAWFPTTIEGGREAGAPLRFVFPHGEAEPMHGTMLRFEPPHVLELRWGDELLRFELRPDGDGTVLTFVDMFDELGKAARDAAGWHSCLDVLEHDVAGRPLPWDAARHWREVHPWYVDHLGAEASTVGPPRGWIDAHGEA